MIDYLFNLSGDKFKHHIVFYTFSIHCTYFLHIHFVNYTIMIKLFKKVIKQS